MWNVGKSPSFTAPPENEDIIVGDILRVHAGRFLDSLDFFWFFSDNKNIDNSGMFEKVGGAWYHMAKAVTGRVVGYHHYGLGEDGISGLCGIPRTVFETGYVEQTPESGLYDAFFAKSDPNNGGLQCMQFGPSTNAGNATDMCFDPYINQQAITKIDTSVLSGNLDRHNIFGVPRMTLNGKVYASGFGLSGGAVSQSGIVEIANVSYFHTGTGSYDIPELRVEDICVNVTGELVDSWGFSCGNSCSNLSIHYSGIEHSGGNYTLTGEDYSSSSGFFFYGNQTGTLIYSGTYDLYTPEWTCLEPPTGGSWNPYDTSHPSASFYQEVSYTIPASGIPNIHCPESGLNASHCGADKTLSGVNNTINFSGMDIPLPDQYYIINLEN